MISTPEKSRLGRAAAAGLATLAIAVTSWFFLACAAEANPAAAASKPAEASGGSGTVLATVEGKPITKAEVEAAATEELEQAKMQLLQCESSYKQRQHEVFDTKTKQMVQDRILETEAGKRGMTKEALLAAEVDAKIAAISDADVDKFFEENKARIGNRPKETVAPQIKQYLGQQRQREAYEGFINSLEAKYAVAYSLEPFRVQVNAVGPAKGPANAPVTIVEWSDFECPFCSRVVPTLNQVKERYGDKVRVVFRQYPLPMHARAQKAAEASLCANEQGKFWELHDAMFADQQSLGVDQLKAKAASLGLDAAKFNECLDSNKHAKTVKDDMRDGSLVGVSGTPAMFINGRMLSGAQPFEEFAKIIDEELKMKGGM